jgi:hypothetical protein
MQHRTVPSRRIVQQSVSICHDASTDIDAARPGAEIEARREPADRWLARADNTGME